MAENPFQKMLKPSGPGAGGPDAPAFAPLEQVEVKDVLAKVDSAITRAANVKQARARPDPDLSCCFRRARG